MSKKIPKKIVWVKYQGQVYLGTPSQFGQRCDLLDRTGEWATGVEWDEVKILGPLNWPRGKLAKVEV